MNETCRGVKLTYTSHLNIRYSTTSLDIRKYHRTYSITTPIDMTTQNRTVELCNWLQELDLSKVPDHVQTRAKYLLLDGIGCALVGAHVPWSEKAAKSILSFEPAGNSTVMGWGGRKLSPLSAALLNSTFVQGFELDDWHSKAPLHTCALLIPAILATSEHLKSKNDRAVSGKEFILAFIAGCEVGPRVGLALGGSHILSEGWHSGAVFGPSPVAASAGKLLGLTTEQMEDAFGIACTQAGGLMSAQFGSEAKRMQHGFASRNGLLGALLAQDGYIGIKRVFEQEYGGFLGMFSKGNGLNPPYKTEEIVRALGEEWELEGINMKPYASMAATHATVDVVKKVQQNHSDQLTEEKLKGVEKIEIRMPGPEFHHGGWHATRPLTSLGAQMSCSYVAMTQMIDHAVTTSQFRHDMLERDLIWSLVDKTSCHLVEDFPKGQQEITITFNDGTSVTEQVKSQKGVDPPLSNEEVVEKFRDNTKGVIDEKRQAAIEKLVLDFESVNDVSELIELLAGETKDPVA